MVGIAPGSAQPGTSVVSFHNDASAEYTAAVVERFGNTQEIDIVAVAQKFYETHEDAYDYLVIYNNMGIGAERGRRWLTRPRFVPAPRGYGVPTADDGTQYGSAARLRSVMNMGRLDYYPLDANARGAVRVSRRRTRRSPYWGTSPATCFWLSPAFPIRRTPTAKPMIGFRRRALELRVQFGGVAG